MERRRLLAALGSTLLFSFAPIDIAYGAKMVAVRMWPAEEYTRVTIETDVALKFKHFLCALPSPFAL